MATREATDVWMTHVPWQDIEPFAAASMFWDVYQRPIGSIVFFVRSFGDSSHIESTQLQKAVAQLT